MDKPSCSDEKDDAEVAIKIKVVGEYGKDISHKEESDKSPTKRSDILTVVKTRSNVPDSYEAYQEHLDKAFASSKVDSGNEPDIINEKQSSMSLVEAGSNTNVCCENMKNEPSCSYYAPEDEPEIQTFEDDGQVMQSNASPEKASNNTSDFNIPNMPDDYKATYQQYIDRVKSMASVPITKSITPEQIQNFKHFNLRYYENKYCVNFMSPGAGYNDLLIRIHSNKLFLISLAGGNDIVRLAKPITGINFIVNKNDRSNIKLGGKRKRGAKVIEPHTILCQVKCEGIPTMFNIRAGVPGRILEINELVKNNPDLLRTDPTGNGYLAVLAPPGHPSKYEKVMANLKLLTEDEYIKFHNERTLLESSEDIVLKYETNK